MAERLQIAALNAENRFATHYSTMVRALEDGKRVPNDILVISEAASDYSDEEDILGDARAFLNERGYAVKDAAYCDEDDRPDKHRLLVAVQRRRLERFDELRLADRTGVGRAAVRACLTGGIDVVGVHLDDRKEKTRRLQAADMLGAATMGRTTIFAGDMNAMHRWNTVATLSRIAKVLRPLSDLLPVGTPGTKQPPRARINSLYRRVIEMADGGTMRAIEEMGYRDADMCHLPTRGFLQLDHIMVPGNVLADDFERLDVYELSDHLGIRAKLRVYPVPDVTT